MDSNVITISLFGENKFDKLLILLVVLLLSVLDVLLVLGLQYRIYN